VFGLKSEARWIGWRLRLLVGAALLGCLGVFALLRWVAATPTLDAQWRAGARGEVVLVASGNPTLAAHVDRVLVAASSAGGGRVEVDAAALQRAPRWMVDDTVRGALVHTHEALARVMEDGPVTLHFEGGATARVQPGARGALGLGLLFWPMTALALLLYLIGVVVGLVRPQLRNALFTLIAWCQAGNLVFIALESLRGLALPAAVVAQDLQLRMALDLVSAAAILHAMTIHPHRVPRGSAIALAGWSAAAAAAALPSLLGLSGGWWPMQATIVALGAASIAVLTWSHHLEPNPFVVVMRRFGFVTVGSLALLVLAVAAASGVPGLQHRVAEVGSVVWYVFFASMLLLVPFVSRSQQLLREFALLAGISTVATSLDLLFVALFSFGQYTSVTLSVFLSLGIYAGARQWILKKITGSNVLTLERSFEKLYRVAREVEAQPSRHQALMLSLLRDLFEPLEVRAIERSLQHARVVGDGSALMVPIPAAAAPAGAAGAWLLRYANRGTRIFTMEDARLADRVDEQLRRAVAYDHAVERGRSEERLRIAQDLHDDIGARLLTLMYKAQDPEMEDYIRHTLQDLKTLTRGLAAAEHKLSHAAAEWKSDIGQRLTAAGIDLRWSFAFDDDIVLSVVQWSGLTRVLRELVSNAIYHAHATRVDISARLAQGRLALVVADDGGGRAPERWSHGLGLGGVRKRVKLMGGRVQWRENTPQGIVCEVQIDSFTGRGEPAAA
jgi:signal transduction histidine kinase